MPSLRVFLHIAIIRSPYPRLNVGAKIASRGAAQKTISQTLGPHFSLATEFQLG